MKTALGQKYIKRLKQITDGTDFFAGCLICEKDLDNDSVICTSCINKSKRLLQAQAEKAATTAQAKPTAQGETTLNINAIKEKVKETTKTVAQETEKATKEIKNKLSEQMENENVKKAVDKSKKASHSLWSFWKSLPKKTQRIVMAVLIVLVIFAFAQGSRGSLDTAGNITSGDLDKEEAQEILEETLEKNYPSMEFQIDYVPHVKQYPNVFKGKVQHASDPNNSGGETLPVYTFTVLAGEQGTSQYPFSATCMVTHDGRISAYGNLISESNSTTDFRIR